MRWIALVVGALLMTAPASAQDRMWAIDDGRWNDPNAWDPVGVPLASDFVSFTGAQLNPTEVQIQGLTPIDWVRFAQGSIFLDGNGASTLQVGLLHLNGISPEVTQRGGTVEVESMAAYHVAGGSPSYTLDGGTFRASPGPTQLGISGGPVNLSFDRGTAILVGVSMRDGSIQVRGARTTLSGEFFGGATISLFDGRLSGVIMLGSSTTLELRGGNADLTTVRVEDASAFVDQNVRLDIGSIDVGPGAWNIDAAADVVGSVVVAGGIIRHGAGALTTPRLTLHGQYDLNGGRVEVGELLIGTEGAASFTHRDRRVNVSERFVLGDDPHVPPRATTEVAVYTMTEGAGRLETAVSRIGRRALFVQLDGDHDTAAPLNLVGTYVLGAGELATPILNVHPNAAINIMVGESRPTRSR